MIARRRIDDALARPDLSLTSLRTKPLEPHPRGLTATSLSGDCTRERRADLQNMSPRG